MTESYFEKIKYEKGPVRVRKKLIETLLKNGRRVHTTPKMVRKWLARFQKEG